jgi:hypothetical protein
MLHLIGKGECLITVVDHEKLECHNSPEEGVIVCDQIGTCKRSLLISI